MGDYQCGIGHAQPLRKLARWMAASSGPSCDGTDNRGFEKPKGNINLQRAIDSSVLVR